MNLMIITVGAYGAMHTQQTNFLQVSQSENMNSIDEHASSQSCVYFRSVKLFTKYEDFLHFTASQFVVCIQ